MRRVPPFLVIFALAIGLTGPAQAQEYPITTGSLQASSSTAEPGAEMSVDGGGFEPGTEVVVTVESDPIELARVNAGATGSFSVIVTLPEDLPAGFHTLKATGAAATGGTLVLETPVQISGPLPFTGTRVNWVLVGFASVALVSLGAFGLRLARR